MSCVLCVCVCVCVCACVRVCVCVCVFLCHFSWSLFLGPPVVLDSNISLVVLIFAVSTFNQMHKCTLHASQHMAYYHGTDHQCRSESLHSLSHHRGMLSALISDLIPLCILHTRDGSVCHCVTDHQCRSVICTLYRITEACLVL